MTARMTPRWMTEKIYANDEREILHTVIVYAEGESKEIVKAENRDKRHLILVDGK